MTACLLPARPEEKLELSLSVSKVKTFRDCKAKFKYSYLDKLPKKEWDFHILGKFLHEVLERFHRESINGSDLTDSKLMSRSMSEAFENYKQNLSIEQLTLSKSILSDYLRNLLTSKVQVLEVERPFYIDIDGKILLNGFIDRVQRDPDNMLHVLDYKTSKSPKYLKNDFFQLKTYAFVLFLEDPKLQRIRTSYLMLRSNMDNSLMKEFDRDEIMPLEDVFLAQAEEIQSEKLFRENPAFLCNYCSYLDICLPGQAKIQKKSFGVTDWKI